MLSKKVIIATRNKNKVKEIKGILKGVNAEILSLDDIKRKIPAVKEDRNTFEGNAIKKAVTISRFTDCLVIADDSGLEVCALSGKPGVRSARFAGAEADDKKNNLKLLKLLKDIPLKKRTARFVCVAAVACNGKLVKTVQGECGGTIGMEPKGVSGFGYDPLFIPNGHKKTFAEISRSFKNKISHRCRAFRQVKAIIAEYL